MQHSLRIITLACAAAAALPLWSAPAAAEDFRDLIRKRVKGDVYAALPSAEVVQAMEFTILLAKTDAQGKILSEQPVDHREYKFKIGDRIRVQVKPLTPMFVYVFHEGAAVVDADGKKVNGQRTCLIPDSTEQPPKAEANKPLILPADGYLEFGAPPGEEKVVVVGSNQADVDLIAMAAAVFKEPAAALNNAQKAEVQKINARVDAKLDSLTKSLTGKLSYRGLLTEAALQESTRSLEKGEKAVAVLEAPPAGQERSTLVMSVGPSGKGRPQLLVNIPLTSTK